MKAKILAIAIAGALLIGALIAVTSRVSAVWIFEDRYNMKGPYNISADYTVVGYNGVSTDGNLSAWVTEGGLAPTIEVYNSDNDTHWQIIDGVYDYAMSPEINSHIGDGYIAYLAYNEPLSRPRYMDAVRLYNISSGAITSLWDTGGIIFDIDFLESGSVFFGQYVGGPIVKSSGGPGINAPLPYIYLGLADALTEEVTNISTTLITSGFNTAFEHMACNEDYAAVAICNATDTYVWVNDLSGDTEELVIMETTDMELTANYDLFDINEDNQAVMFDYLDYQYELYDLEANETMDIFAEVPDDADYLDGWGARCEGNFLWYSSYNETTFNEYSTLVYLPTNETYIMPVNMSNSQDNLDNMDILSNGTYVMSFGTYGVPDFVQANSFFFVRHATAGSTDNDGSNNDGNTDTTTLPSSSSSTSALILYGTVAAIGIGGVATIFYARSKIYGKMK